MTLERWLPRTRQAFALVWLSLALIPLAAVTATVTRLHRHHLSTLAAEWSARGDAAYRAGRASEAVDDFRSAMMYAREDRQLRLRLARALVADGRGAEARGYLLTLWADEPGNGPVNLELGRISARSGNIADAVRYYHGAIEGAWDIEAERRRRESRLELADYLVLAGESARARPELVALSEDMPHDPAVQKTIAALLARAGQSAAAQSVYEQVLAEWPNDAEALGGAGQAAFRSADYPRAARYLARAVARGQTSPEVAQDAVVAQLLLNGDPSQRGLSPAARASRANRAIEAARARLTGCLAVHGESNDLHRLAADATRLPPRTRLRSLVRNPDEIERLMDTVFEIELATARSCGEPTGIDRALQLLALVRAKR